MIKGIFMKYFTPPKPYHSDSIRFDDGDDNVDHDNEIKCGMRNPSTRGKSDDLSCLTSSSTSSRGDQSNAKYPGILTVDSDNNSAKFTSTYLPQVIDPHEWQCLQQQHQQNGSRKRKERQDSTSSITQDRKLVRSNSEEYLPNIDSYEVIRRVSSHEEIKQPQVDNEFGDGVTTPLLQSKHAPDDDDYDDDNDDDDNDGDDVDNERIINRRSYRMSSGDDVSSTKSANNEVQEILREAYRRSETSPARSRTFDFSHKLRVSPSRRDCHTNHHHTNDALSDMHDRRSSERFCKARAAQGFRKSSSSKKSASSSSSGAGAAPASLPSLIRQSSSTDSEQNESSASYKYDITTMKSERRGFTSTKLVSTPTAADSADLDSSVSSECGDDYYNDLSSSFSDHNDNNEDYTDFMPISPSSTTMALKSPSISNINPNNTTNNTSRHESSLPWDYTRREDDVPVKSQRFAENKFDHVNNLRDIDMKLRNESLFTVYNSTVPHFAKGVESNLVKTLKNSPLKSHHDVYTTPDEKLKQINKRLVALKKRVAAYEENFEMENGYRPSLSIKLNERYVKNALAEIHKLRKEKQALKADPMIVMAGYKSSGGSTAQTANDTKVQKMKDTIAEIEKRLQVKRTEENRPGVLEEMTADQLVQEKTAVQRALLYLESLYGRPSTRDERDAARLLYNRYRVIKRLVNRTVSISGAGGLGNNLSELPTILEHEAMAFTVAAISLTPPPSDTENNMQSGSGGGNSTGFDSSTDSTDTSSSINENVHEMSLDGLTRNLEIVRDEKKKLRRTIKEFEEVFEEQNGRKMLKSDRTVIEETYALYKQKKAKLRLLDALVRKQLTH